MKEFIGSLWTESGKDGRVHIGFTRQFIEERLGECFHVMQADMTVVRKGSPMLVIETNDGLESLKSPLSGSILKFNPKARNFPDRLTEEDNILEVLPEGMKLPMTKKKEKEAPPDAARWNFNQMIIDDMFAQRAVAPPQAPQVQLTPEVERLINIQRQEVLQREALRELAGRAQRHRAR